MRFFRDYQSWLESLQHFTLIYRIQALFEGCDDFDFYDGDNYKYAQCLVKYQWDRVWLVSVVQ